jgi:Family of unknown function (DUF6807)
MGPVSDLSAGDLIGRLTIGSHVVAELREGATLPSALVPRPHLHPVRTLGGLLVTEDEPADHRHHLGVGAAVPLVEDTNLWGGPTFVSGTGYLDLHDHGRQDVVTCKESEDGFRMDVRWVDRSGAPLLCERRHVTGRPVPGYPGAWALRHSTRLANPLDRPVVLASPAANGRAGAGYGGVFWRAPIAARNLSVHAPGATGEQEVDGRVHHWVLLTGVDAHDGLPWSVLFVPLRDSRSSPWFVRLRDYPALGPALAWDRPQTIAAGKHVAHGIVAAVVDGHVAPADVPALLVAMPR